MFAFVLLGTGMNLDRPITKMLICTI